MKVRMMATYWQGRLQQIAHSIYHKQEKKNQRLLQEYKKVYQNIQSQIDELYRKFAENEKLSTTEMYKFNRMNDLQNNIKQQVKGLGQNEEKFLGKSLFDNFKDVSKQTIQYINKSVGLKIDWSYLDDKFIKSAINQNWAGKNFSSSIWDNKDKLIKSLNTSLVSSIAAGKSINNIAADIKNTMGAGAYDSLRLARTETMNVINNGQMESFRQAGYSKVIWLTAEDERVCEECGPLNEKSFDIGKAPHAPLHPHCRCTLAADSNSLDE
jgi:SPP1 gp7 family putative phage head morphogenesis protein